MATQPVDSDRVRIEADGAVWRVPTADTQRPESIRDGVAEIDPVQALIELGEAPDFSANGLADQLFAWIAPRPRNPATLTQSRIVPLLGMAADMLSQTDSTSGEIVGLGAMALVQEQRMQRVLADLRATLLPGRDQ